MSQYALQILDFTLNMPHEFVGPVAPPTIEYQEYSSPTHAVAPLCPWLKPVDHGSPCCDHGSPWCSPGVIGSDVPWLDCPACNALTWVITVTE